MRLIFCFCELPEKHPFWFKLFPAYVCGTPREAMKGEKPKLTHCSIRPFVKNSFIRAGFIA